MGVFSAEQRLAHTVLTIDSIRRHDPNAKVAILETSMSPLSAEHESVLRMMAEHYIDYSAETTENYQRYAGTSTLLSVNELVFLQKGFQLIDDSVEHVFKLSGRYHLTDDFNLVNHKQDKIVVLERKPSWIEGEWMYMTRLFSWPKHLTDYVAKMLEQGYNYITSGNQGDIENMLYKFLPQEYVAEIPKLGVHGFIHGTGHPNWD